MNMSIWEGVIIFIKGFVVVMFAMNVAVILTWADRRQGAAIQDRVGPNRAVIWLPTRIAQGALLAPALLVAGGVLALAMAIGKSEVEAIPRGFAAMLMSQAAFFMVWLTGLVIAARVKVRGPHNAFDLFIASLGDPRRFVYGGLAAHALAFAAGIMYRGTETGVALEDVGIKAGAGLLGFAIVAGAGYAAFSIHNEPRVGLRLFGLLHPAADGLKTLWKEDFIPPGADKFLHSIAPLIAFFPALVVLGVVPFANSLCFEADPDTGRAALDKFVAMVPAGGCKGALLPLQVVSLDVGVLYFFALAGTGIVGAALAGWSSDNKYSLLGGVRAASQMVSYEVTMGLTLIGAFMVYGTLRVDEMVAWQSKNVWGIFVQPVAFVLFFVAAVAESKRIPFDIPEGESEIVAGYYTEYAGMKFAMFFFAEYIAVVTSSALMAAVFLGGWDLPFIRPDGLHIEIGDSVFIQQELPQVLVVVLGGLGFVLKTLLLCWVQLTIRWTLPRFRYDQLMRLGWRKLLPTSLANILITGVFVLAVASAGESVEHALLVLSDLTKLLLAVAGLAAGVALFLFLLQPAKKRRFLATSSAQFAASVGGTRTARMEA